MSRQGVAAIQKKKKVSIDYTVTNVGIVIDQN